jgi:glycosyltransferase involved in cell wall biosynthesis
MKVNFIVPPLSRDSFSGGVLCVLEYADGLARLGHDVRVIPMLPSPKPKWFRGRFTQIGASRAECIRRIVEGLRDAAYAMAVERDRPRVARSVKKSVLWTLLAAHRFLPYKVGLGASASYMPRIIADADATMATSNDTAAIVHLYGKGRKYYFCQHLETLAQPGSVDDPAFGYAQALLSYHLGLELIANSTWLKRQLESLQSKPVALCVNAIDHSIYGGSPPARSSSGKVTVISYGGRNAEWKGFREMAQAVRIARHRLPDTEIAWKVYGVALMPPDNPIASYEPLGFLRPEQLARAYRSADILLSASWYESFPLFPIEAMACGLAVITTAAGTEDYAISGETAEIVEPRDPESIARGLERLIVNPDYRFALASKGQIKSREFTWERSVKRMAELLGGCAEKYAERMAPGFQQEQAASA